MRYQWITFTTDYGIDDGFVAACKGVIATIAPDVRVLDVTHSIGPQDIRHGAAVLAHTVEYLPPAVHLAVVDPGVGTGRRPVVLVTGSGLLVGPDNGLLPPVADRLGGISAAYELAEPRYRRHPVSATFHGRDIFAPAAAHLCLGVPPAEFGPAVEDLVRLPEPLVRVEPGRLASEIIGADRFGNIQLAADASALAAFDGQPGDQVLVRRGHNTLTATIGRVFADVPPGSAVLHVDSAGQLAIAVNGGSAVAALDGSHGDLTITLVSGKVR